MVSVSTTVGMLQEPILGKHLAQKTLDKRKLSLLDFCYDKKILEITGLMSQDCECLLL